MDGKYALTKLYTQAIKRKYENIPDDEAIYGNLNLKNNLEYRDIVYLIQNGFRLEDLEFTDDEQFKYDSIIFNNRFNSTAKIILLDKLYKTKKDYEYIRQYFINSDFGAYDILTTKNVYETALNLTKEEIINLLDKHVVADNYYCYRMIEYYYPYLTDKQFDNLKYIFQADISAFNNIMISEYIDINFKLRLYETYNYLDANWIYILKNLNLGTEAFLHSKVFRKILDDDTMNLYRWLNIVSEKCLTNAQMSIICNKYYDELFTFEKYAVFLERCLIFGKMLRKKERELLIKKIKTPTRWKDIDRAKNNINFSSDELAKLDTILLTYKMEQY